MGKLLLVITTSSVEAVHDPLEIVHINVAEAPALTLVTPEVFDEDDVIVAEPETTLQAPVPEDGELAAIVKLPLLH